MAWRSTRRAWSSSLLGLSRTMGKSLTPEFGEVTEFTIRLPRSSQTARGEHQARLPLASCYPLRARRFAPDSSLEGEGFEPRSRRASRRACSDHLFPGQYRAAAPRTQ